MSVCCLGQTPLTTYGQNKGGPSTGNRALNQRDFADIMIFAAIQEDTLARRSSAGNKGLEPVNNLTGLREPFPSSPTNPPKYAVYCSYPHDAAPGQSRMIVMCFLATYAAKHFVNAVLQDEGFKWSKSDTIIGDNGVKVRCEGLEDIIEYDWEAGEKGWELPPAMIKQTELLRREYRDDAPVSTGAEGDEEVERPKKPKKEPKPEKVKVDKTGLVSVGEIAEQMGIEARDARGALRKQKVEKPDGGWLWAPDKVDGIKKIIKAGLK